MSRDQHEVIDAFGAIPDAQLLGGWVSCFARFRGYMRAFAPRLAGLLGRDAPGVLALYDELPRARFVDAVVAGLDAWLPSVDAYVGALDRLGVAAACVWVHVEPGERDALERAAHIAAEHPGRFVPLPSYDPAIADRCAALRRDARRTRLAGVCLLPIVDDRPADDPANDELFETCRELGLPVWVHAVHTWSERHPAEFSHPRTVDRIACRFPGLRLVIGHGGWPWVADAALVAQRHEHVWLEPSSFRWRDLAEPGSGWEPLLRHADGALADKVLFGSLWPLAGGDLARSVGELRALPLAPATLARWSGANARRVYEL